MELNALCMHTMGLICISLLAYIYTDCFEVSEFNSDMCAASLTSATQHPTAQIKRDAGRNDSAIFHSKGGRGWKRGSRKRKWKKGRRERERERDRERIWRERENTVLLNNVFK